MLSCCTHPCCQTRVDLLASPFIRRVPILDQQCMATTTYKSRTNLHWSFWKDIYSEAAQCYSANVCPLWMRKRSRAITSLACLLLSGIKHPAVDRYSMQRAGRQTLLHIAGPLLDNFLPRKRMFSISGSLVVWQDVGNICSNSRNLRAWTFLLSQSVRNILMVGRQHTFKQ